MASITGQVGAQEKLLDAAGASSTGVDWDVSRYSVVATQNIGTWTTATVTFQGSIDGTTFQSIQGTLDSDGTFSATTTTVDEIRRFDVSGYNFFRANLAWTAGTITVLARAMPVGGGGGGSPASVDLNEPIGVEGSVADGSTSTDNPVILGSVDTSGNVQALAVTTAGIVSNFQSTGADGHLNARLGSPVTAAGVELVERVAPHLFNDTTWDRQHGNTDITLLASAARTANTDSSDITNHNAKGIMIILDITVDAVSVGLTPSILMKDPISGKDVTIWTAAAASTGVGTDIFLLYPGVLNADMDGGEAVSIALPRTFVLRITTADADEATYSVGASLIL